MAFDLTALFDDYSVEDDPQDVADSRAADREVHGGDVVDRMLRVSVVIGPEDEPGFGGRVL